MREQKPIAVLRNRDGSCSVVHFTKEFLDKAETRDKLIRNINEHLQEIAPVYDEQGKVAYVRDWRITDESALPKDRSQRDKWTDNNPTKTVDIKE